MKRGFFQWTSTILRILLYPIVVAVDFLNELLVWDGVVYLQVRMFKNLLILIAPWVVLVCAVFEVGGITGEFRGAVMVAAITWIIGSGEAANEVFPKRETDEAKIAQNLGLILAEMKEGKLKTKQTYPLACSGHFEVQTDDEAATVCDVRWKICSVDASEGSIAQFIVGHVTVGSSKFEFDSFHSSINVLKTSFVRPEFCSRLVSGDIGAQEEVVKYINSQQFIGSVKLKISSKT